MIVAFSSSRATGNYVIFKHLKVIKNVLKMSKKRRKIKKMGQKAGKQMDKLKQTDR